MGLFRLVGLLKLGRAVGAPKLPRDIRAGPNEGDTKIGGGVHPGIYLV